MSHFVLKFFHVEPDEYLVILTLSPIFFFFFFFFIKIQSGLLLKKDNCKSIAEMSNRISLPPVTLSGKRLQRSYFLFVEQTTYSRWMGWNFSVFRSFFYCLIAL